MQRFCPSAYFRATDQGQFRCCNLTKTHNCTLTKMAKSFRELIGVPPSTASTKDSVLVIIDAQNE